jgi:cobalamin biosynthesis Mg chelatase CobN
VYLSIRVFIFSSTETKEAYDAEALLKKAVKSSAKALKVSSPVSKKVSAPTAKKSSSSSQSKVVTTTKKKSEKSEKKSRDEEKGRHKSKTSRRDRSSSGSSSRSRSYSKERRKVASQVQLVKKKKARRRSRSYSDDEYDRRSGFVLTKPLAFIILIISLPFIKMQYLNFATGKFSLSMHICPIKSVLVCVKSSCLYFLSLYYSCTVLLTFVSAFS